MNSKKKPMKKKKDWQTKAKKRQIMKKDKGIIGVVFIVRHFFKHLNEWIEEMTDPRHPSYTTYTQSDYVYMALLKNICGVKTMHSMEETFNHENCIRTLSIFSGHEELEEMPHSDSLNNYLRELSPKCLAGLRKKMVKSLLRMKSFYGNRLLGQYWRVILDGTGLYYFKEKHCENCLVKNYRTDDGKKRKVYYHKVLEAKLVLSKKIVISLDTEFIENESEDVDKQDCEVNAAKRLLERLKIDYPRLPICIQADNLYETRPMMELCRKYNFHYIFTHKGTRQKNLDESYELYIEGGYDKVLENIGQEKGVGRYVNQVGKTLDEIETANIFEYQYERQDDEGNRKTTKIQWLTDLELSAKNLLEMIGAGRGRWKIENEGFNNQKNGIYDIEHLNSRNANAMKNHYLLTQVADIVMQLYLAWNPVLKEMKQTIKNTSHTLRESFHGLLVTQEDVNLISRYTTVYLE